MEDSNLYNTRTGLGGFSDRVGALAYALTPLTILLSNRESVLSLLTGIQYQHLNFLHRWVGRIMFIQASLHTLGWTVIEGKLYQPQPSEYARLMSEMYIVFGVVAMFLLTVMLVLSTQTAIKRFGYEVFKITHWILAVLYNAACWGHRDKLWCWMVASLALIGIDQFLRMLKTCYIHIGGHKGTKIGFKCAQGKVKVLGQGDDAVVRLDFKYEHRETWAAGQHFRICFPCLSIWQSHPFTPLSLPNPTSRVQQHSYVIRVREGITKRLSACESDSLPIILTGPYGVGFPKFETQNVLAVAGGTGVTFTLPIVREALRQHIVPQAAVDFVWIVRRAQDMRWISSELTQLKEMLEDTPSLRISIFVTRERDTSGVATEKANSKQAPKVSASSLDDMESAVVREANSARFVCRFLDDHHPSIHELVEDFMERSSSKGGNIGIVGSGPEALGSDLRSAIADVKTSEALDFYWDSRE